MIFLAVLAVATIVAAAARRAAGVRTWARIGLAAALVVAGVAHFAQPTPFEQHLPEWVPATRALVFGTGTIEIALGVALVTLASHLRAVGALTAGYLVAVFPANVYVAVADVDVDGQPGGAYPWIRLPVQALFVAWAIWCSQTPGHEPRDQGGQRALALPWVRGTAADSISAPTIMASRLELQRFRDVPRFLLASVRIYRRFARIDGGIELALRTRPTQRTFWTLSAWESGDALGAFVENPLHRRVMARFAGLMASSSFVTWSGTTGVRPTWEEGLDRLASNDASDRDDAAPDEAPILGATT